MRAEDALLSLKGALSIPVMATLSLVGAYLAVKHEMKILNQIIYGYMIFLAVLVVKKYLYEYFKSTSLQRLDYPILLPLRILKVNLTLLELLNLILSAYLIVFYVQSNFWLMNNLIAYGFAIYAIESWLIGSFRNILVVFVGLFCYDVYFVFGTDMMLTVAE